LSFPAKGYGDGEGIKEEKKEKKKIGGKYNF